MDHCATRGIEGKEVVCSLGACLVINALQNVDETMWCRFGAVLPRRHPP
jgi:hypothetical protein